MTIVLPNKRFELTVASGPLAMLSSQRSSGAAQTQRLAAMDTPKSLGDTSARAARQAGLSQSHIAPLAAFVKRLRRAAGHADRVIESSARTTAFGKRDRQQWVGLRPSVDGRLTAKS